ncbi:MAG: hypothetical protein JXX28_13935 [Deltaproteobacteria bacterium]|nr:hypothetical protein [Deltaproteobacteria bacterium]
MRLGLPLALALILATGCRKEEEDADGDGYLSYQDCDDLDAAVNAGATEVCDGIDNDCDGAVDEDALDASAFHADADGDGFGSEVVAVMSCLQPEGYVEDATDCDDGDADFHPGAPEDCAVPEDFNCDGSVGYADADGDGFPACEECDDGDAGVNPGALEVCDGIDNDCDGTADVGAVDADTWYGDADGDGYGDPLLTTEACALPEGYARRADDCDDGAAEVHPGADERCNGLDDDCDGSVDVGALDARTYYADSDGDGYGGARFHVDACEAPEGYVEDASDCDDLDAAISPDTLWHADRDDDGFGSAQETLVQCAEPDGYTLDARDCDDADAALHPDTVWHADADADGYGAEGQGPVQCEAPEGFVLDDQDCDDADPTLSPETAWYLDRDGDGYGADATLVHRCALSGGYVRAGGDCDDTDGDVNPDTLWHADGDGDGYGAPSLTLGQCAQPEGYVLDDQDCEDGDPEINPETVWHADADGDGYGAPLVRQTRCLAPAGHVLDASDCDDTDATLSPDTVWYLDGDGDGYGDPGTSLTRCERPGGFVLDGEDCDDDRDSVSPAADEIPGDGVDNDCGADGDTPLAVYVPERSSGNLIALRRDTGARLWTATLGTGLIDAAAGPDGTVYAGLHDPLGDGSYGGLAAVSPDGLTVQVLTESLGYFVHQVFYDFGTDTVLVFGDGIWEVDPVSGATSALLVEEGIIGGLRLQGDDRIWYTNRTELRLKVFDPATGLSEAVSNEPVDGNLLVPAADGRLYTARSGTLVAVDLGNGDVEALESIDAAGICEDPIGGDGLLWGNHAASVKGLRWGGTTSFFILNAALDTPWGCGSNLYPDMDGDGYDATALGGSDCDDRAPSIHPGATDWVGNGVDEDCDGFDGTDRDGDGALSVALGGTDCDDTDPTVFFGSEGCGSPHSCEDIRAASPYAPSGLYAITTALSGTELTVWCEMGTRGGGWTRLYYQDSTDYADGEPRFFEVGQTSAHPEDPEARLYAILNLLGEFRRDGEFELLMRWPDHGTWTDEMQWSQVSNPVTDAAGALPTGYAGLHIPYTSNGWSLGLQHSARPEYSLLDGTITPSTNWYYAVGTTYCWGGEPNPCQPAPNGGAHKVELLVR